MLLLLISLFAGFLTILAPCVLPLLPVIIGGSIGGSKKDKLRPYIIGASLAISIILFTLLLKVSTLLIGLPPSVLDWLSGGILVLLGLVSTFPELWEKLVIALNWQAASQRFLGKGERNKSKYGGPVLIGVALGPVFASCSPTYAFILASVLPFTFAAGLIYLAVYSLGLALALLTVSLVGRKLVNKFTWAVDTHGLFRRMLGVLFIVIGIGIISGYQIKAETWVANRLPFDEAKVEQVLLAKQHQSSILHKISQTLTGNNVLNVQPTPAPEFQGLTNWINSSPLTLLKLKGKVVLVDFWTYSCINCIRTLPYIEKWYQTYEKEGFVVVGVNTPEFAFEHNPANVRAAVKSDHITYPVALDNNYETWNAFNNDSWPADYLIDRNGNIRYVSLGEGDYGTTEQAIQELMGVNKPLQTPTSNVPISSNQTPETYFGGDRRSGFSGSVASSPNSNGSYRFTATSLSQLPSNSWTITGNWFSAPQSITSSDNSATLSFNFMAKDVYMVASSNNPSDEVTVSLSSADAGQFGADDPTGLVRVSNSRLYHIVSLKQFGSSMVTLTVPSGVSLYTFTFGS